MSEILSLFYVYYEFLGDEVGVGPGKRGKCRFLLLGSRSFSNLAKFVKSFYILVSLALLAVAAVKFSAVFGWILVEIHLLGLVLNTVILSFLLICPFLRGLRRR